MSQRALLMSTAAAPSFSSDSSSSSSLGGDHHEIELEVDPVYPGTAVERMRNVHQRVRNAAEAKLFDGDWASVCRPALLWAGGLRDLRTASPGKGYTGHSFNDWNHCDLTTMRENVASNVNDGRVSQCCFSL